MGRIFIDGFESGGDDLWDAEANAAVVSIAGLDMDGSYCLDLTAASAYVSKDITADDEMYFAFLWRSIAVATHQPIILFYNGATYLSSLFRNNSTNNLDSYRGTTVVASGTKTIANSTTYLIEVRFKVADAGGRFVVKVDSVTDIDFTGDTKEGANTQFNKVRLGYYTAGYHGKAYFDNLIMDDAAWIDKTYIQALVPIGVGNTTGWTPSVGANWQCVDEKPASDADYVSINSNDAVDTYATANMVGAISDIKCVQIQSRVKTDGVPTPTNLKLVVRSGGTDYLSGDKVVPATAKSLWNLWENNPADAAAWEETDVNAMEIGVESAA